jgi:hypothetical protein
MAGIPRSQGRANPKLGPSDSSDSGADRPNRSTDTDAGGTGERVTVGKAPESELHDERAPDRVVQSNEAGLGGGLDQAEEAQLGVTDEELMKDLEDEDPDRKPKP